MHFTDQFQKFDPIKGDVPSHPFSELPDIAKRARFIVRGLNLDKIISIAKKVNEEIDDFFELEKYIFVSRAEESVDFAEVMKKFESWPPEDEDMDSCGIDVPTNLNTSEVEALRLSMDNRYSNFFIPDAEPEHDTYKEGKDYELFAVLSLWMLSDAINYSKNDNRTNLSIAGEYAIKAMDAVCYAEYWHEINFLENEYNIKTKRRDQKQQENAKKNQKKKMYDLNKKRHAPNRYIKKIAIEKWEEDRTKYSSAAKFGSYISQWLEDKGYNREPRTVTNWLLDHAKKNGVKFR